MQRPTIKDIAEVAGVSPSAVSFALNGRPGVSQSTRQRIVAVANEMGWTPNVAARALSASRAGALGLVIARPSTAVSAERFFFEFIVGMQGELTRAGMSLVLQIVETPAEEIATYRTWWSQRRVDGVVVVDPRSEDQRLPVLAELSLPYVLVGEVDTSGMPSVLGDEEGMIDGVLTHLVEQGRERIAYVCGTASVLHNARRSAALSTAGRRAGVEIMVDQAVDYTERSGGQATAELMGGRRVPDAIVYDNEVLTVGGVAELRRSAVQVGTDVAVVSLEDSSVLRLLDPPITAVHRDPGAMAQTATRLLVDYLDDGVSQTVRSRTPGLTVRASSRRPAAEALAQA
ncbi:MAG: LacI family DNA-binding transcriptional regulator [Actinomyces urogenitalis]|uniref:LacI family DNA-binding transcriptional regulator n=1 Tax=Actinomyces urogenitalis TaxID=103621 RepID=UPI002A81FDC8|nr:LacI family DNA-binding transcriptional regulator [Actinomyces urogenitalis]MDY3678351.1 LacI family DNA-binding transcriptional regulator [Actinomyces urogenitalis]